MKIIKPNNNNLLDKRNTKLLHGINPSKKKVKSHGSKLQNFHYEGIIQYLFTSGNFIKEDEIQPKRDKNPEIII